jgi:hypothetical protein
MPRWRSKMERWRRSQPQGAGAGRQQHEKLDSDGETEKLACSDASDSCGLHGGVDERNGRERNNGGEDGDYPFESAVEGM